MAGVYQHDTAPRHPVTRWASLVALITLITLITLIAIGTIVGALLVLPAGWLAYRLMGVSNMGARNCAGLGIAVITTGALSPRKLGAWWRYWQAPKTAPRPWEL